MFSIKSIFESVNFANGMANNANPKNEITHQLAKEMQATECGLKWAQIEHLLTCPKCRAVAEQQKQKN